VDAPAAQRGPVAARPARVPTGARLDIADAEGRTRKEAEVSEQVGTTGAPVPVEVPVDVPVEDAAEQATPVSATSETEDAADIARDLPPDADPADVAEQTREVDLDEDEYR